MMLLARRLRETNVALAAATFLPLHGRMARVLLGLAAAFGNDIGGGRILIRQKVTQSDLAGMAGLARENVSRILKDWTDRSLVSRRAGYYYLENRAAIQRQVSM
jgi:CRP-like cAMP-binding protein